MNYSKGSSLWRKAVEELKNPVAGIELLWWPELTRFIGGLRPHELTLICAPTGAGKTQLLANISAQLLEQRISHFVAPVETGDVDYMKRVASSLVKRDYNSGEKFSESELARVESDVGKVLSGPINIAGYDNRVDAQEMIDMLAYQHERYGAKVALLDNLNFFLKIVSTQMERAEMDAAMHEFVMLAKKLPLHIMLIVHPKKTDGGRVESEFDIKGSSTAVQECSNVMLFNRPSREHMEGPLCRRYTDREIVFRKIRKRGESVGRPIWLGFEGGRYKEFARPARRPDDNF